MKALTRSLALMLLASGLLAGCGSLEPSSAGQEDARRAAEQSHDLQLRVMRFADEYAGRTKEALLDLKGSPEDRVRAQTWKLQQVRAAYTIASGPNPVSNALDMVVLASLSRMALDHQKVTERFGERARPLREASRVMERDSWGLVKGVLTEAQTAQLRDIISRWEQKNPQFQMVAYIRFDDLAKSVGAHQMAAEGPGAASSLFSVLGLDPLAGLDPAVREIDQTRQLAERTIFYFQHVPDLVDMQVERLSDQFAAMPETQSLIASVDRISLVGTASEHMVQSLPGMVDKEREALVSQVMQELDKRSEAMSALNGDVQSTLVAGTETAKAVQAVLEMVDRIEARDERRGKRPLDIRDITDAARETAVTAQQLDALTERANAMLPVMRQATDETADRIERLINHLYLQLLMLVVAAIAASLLAALVYRAVAARIHNHETPARGAR